MLQKVEGKNVERKPLPTKDYHSTNSHVEKSFQKLCWNTNVSIAFSLVMLLTILATVLMFQHCRTCVVIIVDLFLPKISENKDLNH